MQILDKHKIIYYHQYGIRTANSCIICLCLYCLSCGNKPAETLIGSEAKSKYVGLVSRLDVMISTSPDSAYLYYARAIYNFGAGDTISSERDFATALSLGKRDSEIYYHIGAIKANSGLYQESLGYFKRSLEYDSTFALTYYGVGAAEYKLKRYQQAIIYLDSSLLLARNASEHEFAVRMRDKVIHEARMPY